MAIEGKQQTAHKIDDPLFSILPQPLKTPVVDATAPTTDYYTDTISSATAESPKVNSPAKPTETKENVIESNLDMISRDIDERLKQKNINFEELQRKIYQIIMLLMRRAAKTDQEYISELNIQIKAQAVQVQGTYNTWPGVTITVISAVVSIGAGAAGLSQLLPRTLISQNLANILSGNAQTYSTVSTGISGIGSLFNSRNEATRGVMQIHLKRTQDKEEDRKGAKHSNNESRKSARSAQDESARMLHDAAKSVLGG